MNVPVPFRALWRALQWVWDRLTKRLLLPTYRHSHSLWVSRHRLGAHWTDSHGYFEYSTYIATSADPEPRSSKLAIRTMSDEIDLLELIIEADSGAARYQELVTVVDVTTKPIIYTLVNIPHEELLDVSSEGGVRFSWHSFHVSVRSMRLKSGIEVGPYSSLVAHPTYSWLLNSTWKRRWGVLWNLDAIAWAKGRIGEYWRFAFGMPRVRQLGRSGDDTSRLRKLVIFATRPIAGVMASPPLLTMQFWIAIWSGMWRLDPESELRRNSKKTEAQRGDA